MKKHSILVSANNFNYYRKPWKSNIIFESEGRQNLESREKKEICIYVAFELELICPQIQGLIIAKGSHN